MHGGYTQQKYSAQELFCFKMPTQTSVCEETSSILHSQLRIYLFKEKNRLLLREKVFAADGILAITTLTWTMT